LDEIAIESAPVEEQPLWHLVLAEGIFVVIAAVIIYFRHSTAAISFVLPAGVQAVVGVLAGAILGVLTGVVVLRTPLRGSVVRGVLPLRPVTATVWSIVVTGLAAGVGEELLFRAALVPWIGLWWAALLFGIAHSGTARLQDGVSLGKVAYLIAAVAMGVVLGVLYQRAGLLSSMSAHASFDVGTLLVLAPVIGSAAQLRASRAHT
jgi:membrane protease YdiL (CAAX protease family)